jgi:hypothetical protein
MPPPVGVTIPQNVAESWLDLGRRIHSTRSSCPFGWSIGSGLNGTCCAPTLAELGRRRDEAAQRGGDGAAERRVLQLPISLQADQKQARGNHLAAERRRLDTDMAEQPG